MRKLLAIVVIAALAWGGYWFIGSAAVERALAGWFEGQRADGWLADYSSLNTAGFPSRFDTTITDLSLADPQSGLAWTAPMFQILALSYKPHHVILAFPPTQTIATPSDEIAVQSERMRASVVFRPDTALTLDHSALVMSDVTLTGSSGWTGRFDSVRLATRQSVAQDNTHDIAFEASGFTPPDAMRGMVDPAGARPTTIETLKIDATVGFDAPWDRFAAQGDRPRITGLELNTAHATWGRLDLRGTGTLDIDSAGIATGRITVTATGWRDMLDMAHAAGLLSDETMPTLEKALTLLAGLSGDAGTLDVPLDFKDGLLSLGPLPLGPAPRLWIN